MVLKSKLAVHIDPNSCWKKEMSKICSFQPLQDRELVLLFTDHGYAMGFSRSGRVCMYRLIQIKKMK